MVAAALAPEVCKFLQILQNMSQDNKNPVVYRSQKKSFHVPSENSNYIDLYETRRRSKTSSPTTEPIVEKRIILEDRRDASICEGKMKTTLVTGIGESQGSSSFQLSQVSNEVEKLKEMMESWSNGKDSVGQSQSIARDLLRGALDLQESLVMLGKLQEASNFMAGLKKKSRPKFEADTGKDTNAESVGFSRHGRYGMKMENPRTSVDGSKNSVQDLKNVIRESLSRPNLQVSEESSFREDVNAQNLGLDRFRNYSYRQRSDDPRISVDRYSGNRREELKNIIRDSLSKQNLISALSPPSDEVKPFSTQKQPICLPDVCSSSSSRSYSAPSDGGCQKLSEINVLHQPKKANSPNLIAKLMGLETLPSETAETKKSECRTKKSSQWTPVINIEMPKVKKLQIVDDDGDPGRKALKEILDSMQFKGLLKSNHSGDLKFHSDFLSGKTQKLNTEKPPIVIIKPLHSSGYGKDEMSGYGKDEMSDYGKDEMSEYGKDEMSGCGKDEMSGCGKDEMSGCGKYEMSGYEKDEICTYKKDEICTYKKDEICRYKKDGISSYKKDDLQTDELVKQYRASDSIPLLTEVAKEDTKTKQKNEKVSGTGRASVSYISRSYKKEANKLPKKGEKMPKGVSDGRNSSHKENTKSTRTLKSQQKTIPSKTRKIEASPLQQKNLATTQVITLQQHKPRRSTKSVQFSTNQTRKTKTQIAKVVKKSIAMELDIENNKESQDDDNKTDSSSSANDLSASTCALPTDEASMETRQEEVEILIRDDRECEPKPLSEDMPEVDLPADLADDLADDLAGDLAADLASNLAANLAEGCQPTEETEQLLVERIPSSKSSKDELKLVLLSSPSFISSAEELFHFHLDQPLVCHTSKVDDINTSLVLDCADELMGHKSRQRAIASHQNKTHILCKVRFTLNQLVEEIVDGIEDLSYSKIGDHSFGTENLYLMLERDLLCSSMVVNGVWDLGWLNGLNLEETEQIVGEVEKHVVEALVQEAVMELVS
ncbi:hypothetical protein H6P81_000607 [Aristolochia fimbriata]|uniref:DUF3741 domain-containing protein n=1 Tax=Aristolochia fimbriata TaxID=158543 RepID=A0AAV7F674_ARIFI|nr:hypothetical protein H6P81_000607 [Aristolochia fimbriata]